MWRKSFLSGSGKLAEKEEIMLVFLIYSMPKRMPKIIIVNIDVKKVIVILSYGRKTQKF